MQIVQVTYEYTLNEKEIEIIKYLGEHNAIYIIRDQKIPLREQKDVTNQFLDFDIGKMDGKKMLIYDYEEYEKNKYRNTYRLNELGYKILEQLTNGCTNP